MKKDNIKYISIIIGIIILLLILIPNISCASFDLDKYKPEDLLTSDYSTFIDKVEPIISAIATFGVVLSVITVIVIGIKYMVGSASEKADYKNSMIPFLVGAIMIFGISTVLKLAIEVAQMI